MPLKTNAQEWLDKHERNTTNALSDTRRGIERVTEAPGIAAAAAQERMKANLVASIDSGRWGRNVAAVSVQDWKNAAIAKGLNRIGPGIAASKSKNLPVIQRTLAAVESAQAEVLAMPKGTLQESINRMSTFVTRMHEAKVSGAI